LKISVLVAGFFFAAAFAMLAILSKLTTGCEFAVVERLKSPRRKFQRVDATKTAKTGVF
jgi:hypothetical protein